VLISVLFLVLPAPMWTMRTIILGFLSFFMEKTSTGIGHIDTTDDVKKGFAEGSAAYNNSRHEVIMRMFPTE